jgi:hypothetical protein
MDYEPLEYGGYVFSCDKESDFCLCRSRPHEAMKSVISDGTCRGFVMDNGQLFYATDSGIHRLFYNQGNSRLISNDVAAFLTFAEGYLYYTALSGGVYRVKPDGSDRLILNNDDGRYLKVYNGMGK